MRWHFWAPKMADNSKIRDAPNGTAPRKMLNTKLKPLKWKANDKILQKFSCFLLFASISWHIYIFYSLAVDCVRICAGAPVFIIQGCWVCVNRLLKVCLLDITLSLHHDVCAAHHFSWMPVPLPLITISCTFRYLFFEWSILNAI